MATPTPATLDAPTLAASSDTGVSNSDRITNESEPIFTGSAQIGATVTIYELGYPIGSGVAADGNYSIHVVSLAPGPDAITAVQTVNGVTSAASPSTTVTLDQTLPTGYVPFQTVPHNSGPTPIGIVLGDNLTPVADLSVAIGLLPDDGTVTLADGTPVHSGDKLTGTQTQGLLFTPNLGASRTSTAPNFNFTLSDAAGNASFRTGVIDVAGPSAPDAVSFAPTVTFRNGVFTLSGTASSADDVRNVEISAMVDGVARDLGAATVNPDGSFAFQDAAGGQQGFFVAALTDGAGGTATSADPNFSLSGVAGPSGGQGRQTRYTTDGSADASVTRFLSNGSQRVSVEAGGQTFASSFFDTFNNKGAPDTTFVFNPGHGLDIVNGFRVGGEDYDSLSFTGSDFGNSVAQVLQNTYQTDKSGNVIGHAGDPIAQALSGISKGAGVIIYDPTTQDTVKVNGITKGQLAANQGDFAFHA